ncbi:hypothetical protein C0Q70_01394 [Pomacea canaliculata]|uniref:Uncharacterized protein n=1 Tax=Pomacea canaliculata TaxID=400727 RepID=A0A2T7PZC8_POMCA|nr:hypothetical protein C0Q70_01394 [Pomacea canaliculata]
MQNRKQNKAEFTILDNLQSETMYVYFLDKFACQVHEPLIKMLVEKWMTVSHFDEAAQCSMTLMLTQLFEHEILPAVPSYILFFVNKYLLNCLSSAQSLELQVRALGCAVVSCLQSFAQSDAFFSRCHAVYVNKKLQIIPYESEEEETGLVLIMVLYYACLMETQLPPSVQILSAVTDVYSRHPGMMHLHQVASKFILFLIASLVMSSHKDTNVLAKQFLLQALMRISDSSSEMKELLSHINSEVASCFKCLFMESLHPDCQKVRSLLQVLTAVMQITSPDPVTGRLNIKLFYHVVAYAGDRDASDTVILKECFACLLGMTKAAAADQALAAGEHLVHHPWKPQLMHALLNSSSDLGLSEHTLQLISQIWREDDFADKKLTSQLLESLKATEVNKENKELFATILEKIQYGCKDKRELQALQSKVLQCNSPKNYNTAVC